MNDKDIQLVDRVLQHGNIIEHRNLQLVKTSRLETSSCIPLELINGKNKREINEPFEELLQYLRTDLERPDEKDLPYDLRLTQYEPPYLTSCVEDIIYDRDTTLVSLIPKQKSLKEFLKTHIRANKITISNNTSFIELIDNIIGQPCNSLSCIGKCCPVKDHRVWAINAKSAVYNKTRVCFARLLPQRLYDGLRMSSETSVGTINRYLQDVYAILIEMEPKGACLVCSMIKQKLDHKAFNKRISLTQFNDFNKGEQLRDIFPHLMMHSSEDDKTDCDLTRSTNDTISPFVFDETNNDQRPRRKRKVDHLTTATINAGDDNTGLYDSFGFKRPKQPQLNLLDGLEIRLFENDQYGIKHQNIDKVYM